MSHFWGIRSSPHGLSVGPMTSGWQGQQEGDGRQEVPPGSALGCSRGPGVPRQDPPRHTSLPGLAMDPHSSSLLAPGKAPPGPLRVVSGGSLRSDTQIEITCRGLDRGLNGVPEPAGQQLVAQQRPRLPHRPGPMPTRERQPGGAAGCYRRAPRQARAAPGRRAPQEAWRPECHALPRKSAPVGGNTHAPLFLNVFPK